MSSKSDYTETIDKFWRLVQNIDNAVASGASPSINCDTARSLHERIPILADMARCEYPFYSQVLLEISPILFRSCINGMHILNIAAFGELYLIVRNLKEEPFNLSFWSEIHPRIKSASLELYSDGHFGAAAEKSIKEVEQRLREIFAIAKPMATEPKDATQIVGALLSENGAYSVTKCRTPSERSYSRGVKLLFDGFLASYRNPSFHGNKSISKHEAIEQITLSSQLMFILDSGSITPIED